MMADILKMSPKERAEVLAVPGNRSLVESFGTNLLLLSGKDTPLDKLQVGLIYRNHPQTNTPDGIGPLGGIAEIIAWEDFVSLSPNEQNNLIGIKDNVIAGKDGNALFLTDKNLIRINNIAREVKEELTDIGIIPPSLDFAKMELADLPGIKDDSYIINVWNGQKPAADVFAINPQGLEDSAKRAQKIKDGTYDFALDEVENDDGFDELPDELQETEEDRLLDEKDAAANARFDKVMKWAWIGVGILAAAFVIYKIVSIFI